MASRRARAALGLVYDTGALIAAERDDRRMWAIHTRALARGVRPTIPAGCLVEVWHTGRQTSLSRLLEGCGIEPLTTDTAKRAGTIRARAGVDASAVDATVAEAANRTGAAIVTSDRGDIESLMSVVRRRAQIIDI